MRRLRILLFTVLAVTMSGCFAGPSSQEVQQLQMRVAALKQRINQLEQARGASSSWSQASAGDTTFAEESPSSTREASATQQGPAGNAFMKFFRGGVNLITGWVEIPKRIQETTQRSGAGAGLTFGLLRGFGYGFIRTAGGVYELVTFPVPAPPGYQPVMQPPFVFQADSETP